MEHLFRKVEAIFYYYGTLILEGKTIFYCYETFIPKAIFFYYYETPILERYNMKRVV